MLKISGPTRLRFCFLALGALLITMMIFGARCVYASELSTNTITELTTSDPTIIETDPGGSPLNQISAGTVLTTTEASAEPVLSGSQEPKALPAEPTAVIQADPAAPVPAEPADPAVVAPEAPAGVNEEPAIVPQEPAPAEPAEPADPAVVAPEVPTGVTEEPAIVPQEPAPADPADPGVLAVEAAPAEAVPAEADMLPRLIDPSGFVYDARTKLPIRNAEVTLYRQNALTPPEYVLETPAETNPQLTAADGSYAFTVGPEIYYRITASMLGYMEASLDFQQTLFPSRIDFYLLPGTNGWVSLDGAVNLTGDIILPGENVDIVSAQTDNPFKSITLAEERIISTRTLAPGDTAYVGGNSTGTSGALSMTAPVITIGNRAKILTHSDNESYASGSITMTAQDTNEINGVDFIPVVNFDQTVSRIDIGEGVVMKGGQITLLAKSISDYRLDEEITDLASLKDAAVNTAIEKLETLQLLGGYSEAKADAVITVKKDVQITSDSFSAKAESYTTASSSPTAFGIGVAIGNVISNADVIIEGNITTEGDCFLNARTENTLQVVGSAGGIKGAAFAIAVSILNSDATVRTTEWSDLTVGGKLTLLAETIDRNLTLARSKTGDDGMIGMSAAVSYENGTTNALLEGSAEVTGDIKVEASAVKDSIDQSKLFGTVPVTSIGVAASAGVNTSTYGSILDDTQSILIGRITDKAKALFTKVKDLVKTKSDAQQAAGEKTQGQTAPFDIAAAVAVYLDINETTARIGRLSDPLVPSVNFAIVTSQGSVLVSAVTESQPVLTASASIAKPEATDPPAEPTPETEWSKQSTGTKFAGSAAVAIGIFTNNAQAVIAQDASVDAAGDLIVKAESLNDFEFVWGLNLIRDVYKTYLALGGEPDYKVSDGEQYIYSGEVVLKDDSDTTRGTPGHHYMYLAEYDSGLVIYGKPMDLATADFNGSMWFDLGSLEQKSSDDIAAEIIPGDIVRILPGHLAGGEEGNLYQFLGSIPKTLDLTRENFLDPLKWEDLGADWVVQGKEFIRTFTSYLDAYGTDNHIFNTWSQSTAKGAEVGICGAVSVLDLNGTAKATIDDNARINQKNDAIYRTGNQKVVVSAHVVNEAVHLGGNIELPVIGAEADQKKVLKIKPAGPGYGDEAERAAMGGTVLIIGYDNVAEAMIHEGVALYAKTLDVSADTSSFSFTFSASGGSAGDFAFNGTFSLIGINNRTWAGIDNGARIVLGGITSPSGEPALRISANDTSFIINLTGGIARSTCTGIGASIAVDEITRDTQSFIGNELTALTCEGKPADAVFTVTQAGPVTITANNDGYIFSLALAAATAKDKAPDPAKPEEEHSGSKFGLGVSAEVVINELTDTALAYIHDAALKGASFVIEAGNKTLIIGAGGSMAMVTTKNTSVGLAGSFAWNKISNNTKSVMDNSDLELTGNYDASADGSERIISICASGSAATSSKSLSVAGQVSINTIGSQTASSILNGSELTAQNVKLTSQDNSLIFSVAGALAYGGKGGIGASVAFNDIPALGGRNVSISTIEASDVKASGLMDLDAQTRARIIAITAALGASKEGMAAAISVSENSINGDTKVYITGMKQLGQDIEGAVTMDAEDDSYIFSLAGSLAASSKASFGVALSYNHIDKAVLTYVENTTLDGLSLTMNSRQNAAIHNITAGGAGAQQVAAGGSVSVNNILADTETYIKKADVETSGDITLSAEDNLKIGAIAGTVNGAGKAAFGLAAAVNNIGTSGTPTVTRCYIEDSKAVSANGMISLSAVSNAIIKNLTGAGTGAGDVAANGAVSVNNIYSIIEAYIKNCGTDLNYIKAADDVVLKAEDHSSVSIITVTIAGAGKAAAGAAVGTVNIGSEDVPHLVAAVIDSSKIESTTGAASLQAKADAVVFNFAGGVAVGGTGGAQGSVAANNVHTNVRAQVNNNSVINTKTGVTLKAYATNRESMPKSALTPGEETGSIQAADMESDNDSEDDRRITTIQSLAGAVAGGGSGSIGAAVAVNTITMDVTAAIEKSVVTTDGSVILEAVSEASIETLAAAITASERVAVAVGTAFNEISNDTTAKIADSTITSNFIETDPLNRSGIILTAMDTSKILAIAGQVSVAAAGGGLGAAWADNTIENDVTAYVKNSSVTARSSLVLDADSDSTIKTVAIGGGFGLYVNLTGSIARNTIANNVLTDITNSTVSADQGVFLDAVNSSEISALAGSVSTSAYAAIGASIAINNIGCKSQEADDGYSEDRLNDKGTKIIVRDIAPVGTRSWIENSKITSGTKVSLMASTDSLIRSISAAGGGAIAAMNGAISINNIYQDTESFIRGCSDGLDPPAKFVFAAGDITLEAYDNSAASTIAGNLSIGFAGFGAAVSTVNIGDAEHVNKTRAFIDNSRVTSEDGSIRLTARSNSFLFNAAAGAAFGGIGIQGSAAVNNVRTDTWAGILNSKTSAKGDIKLEALIAKRESIPESMLKAQGNSNEVTSFDGNPEDNDGTAEQTATTHALKTIQSLAGAVAGGGSAGIGA